MMAGCIISKSRTARGTAGILCLLCLLGTPFSVEAEDDLWQRRTVTFLGTSLDRNGEPVGVVAQLILAFRKQERHGGVLNVSFASGPGKFSALTQVAIQEGIKDAALAAGFDATPWDVFLTVPYPGLTIYGESVSATVGLTVLAMANQDPILSNRVMTGKITRDGHIGAVGGIPLKIQAAHAEHIQRVIIPDARYLEDNDWENPFLMHISPVNTVGQAYRLLTGCVLPRLDRDG